MGVCRFFQQGTCRYGTKCHNEHFDVKQYLKADIESGLNGKMWPFSVYGPFKDKANFPNFIEDQSFEEVRFLCYESKRQNQMEQFHQQFSREVMEAQNKMKAMLQMSPQIIDVMCKIYDTPEGSAPAAPGNPFGAAAAGVGGAAAASIFSKPTLSAGNIFGGGLNQVNQGNSVFGGSMNTAQNANSGIFGGAAPGGGTNIFGQQPQQQQQQPSIFAQQQPSIFAPQQQTPQQPAPQNPFNQQANASSFQGFAQPVFGGFQQQQQQQPQTQPQGASIFAAPVAGNLFAQAAVQPQPAQPPTGFFSQAATTVGFPQQQQQQMQPTVPQPQAQQPQQQSQPNYLTVHSRLEDLSAEEIEAFKAEQFMPGILPFNPPPREYC